VLWYCAYTWNPGTTVHDVRGRILLQHEAGTNHPEHIRGWYDMVGGGAGFMLIETDSPQEINDILQPYMDLMDWDVRALNVLDYNRSIERFRQEMYAATS
jgi:uncharacterized protein DUF3303